MNQTLTDPRAPAAGRVPGTGRRLTAARMRTAVKTAVTDRP